MATIKPHYLLFCDGCLLPSGALHTESRGRWRFVLEDIVTGMKTEASDCEPSDHVDRTSLLAVTRGLEALEQPSRVTLVTTSRYVARGLQYGLVEWREHDYCWEHFGSIQPIRNADLWRRVDVALRFHEVQCRWMSQESPTKDDALQVAVKPLSIASTELVLESPSAPFVDGLIDASSENPFERSLDACREATERRRLLYTPSETQTERSEAPIPACEPISCIVPIPDLPAPSIPQRRLLMTGASRPVMWLWNVILALDAFIVSCVRCLFLLDPRRDHFRRRNF
jgi:ribonuclease HI